MSNQFQNDVEIDLRAVFAAVGRSLPWLILLAIVVGAATFTLLSLADPQYRAQTTVLIETGESELTRTADATETAALLDQQGIASQVQLIRSRGVALAVINQLNLTEIAEFDPAQQQPSLIDRVTGLIGIGGDDRAAPPVEEVVLNEFMKRLEVNPVEATRVISIAFVSADPQLAADIANAVAQQYIAQQQEVQRTTTAVATEWLEREIEALSARVVEAERNVELYRAQSNLFRTGQNVTITAQRLADTSAELSRVRTQASEAEAKAALIRTTLETGRSLSSLDVLNSPLIQRLREAEVLLRGQIAEASATLLPNHPRLRELNAQLADLEEAVRSEARNVLAGLETEAMLARSYEAELAAAERELQTATAAANQDEVQLRALERVATAERDLLETYLALAREAVSRQNADYLPVNARIISSAAAAIEPYFPKPLPMAVVAMLVTIMLGAAFVLVRELASGRATRPGLTAPMSMAAAEDDAGGRGRWSDGGDIRRMMPRGPGDRAVLDANLERSLAPIVGQIRQKGAHRVLITTAEDPADDGRPLAAVALARTISRSGARVLLVDLHGDDADSVAMGEVGDLPGFGDLFTGEASFAQVIFRDRSSPVHFIPVGRLGGLEDLTDGDRLPTLAMALDQTYDHVVYDIGEELIPILGPDAGAAVLVTSIGPTEPRTASAAAEIRSISAAEVMVLVAEAPSKGKILRKRAGAAA